eukprot:g7728.t1
MFATSSDQSLRATCTKWSQYDYGTLVTGWTDGRVSFSEASASGGNGGGKGGKTKLLFPAEDCGSVVDLRHDPNRGPYLLIGYSSGTVVLWDAAGHCSIATFDRCIVGLAGIRWMAWAPGNFLALSSKTGVAKVFNISQKNPIGTVKLGETGSGADGNATSVGPRAICGFKDGSLSVADTAFRGVGGPGIDGGGSGSISSGHIGNGNGEIPWASKAGHIETVFSCEHRPGDPDTLATGSYGASVKVWHVPTMDLKVTLTGQTGAIYCVAWNPDGDRIASSSGEGTVWVWDVSTGRALERIRLHSRACHRVQWDPFHNKRLASVGADKSLVIFSDAGAVHRMYVHPDALFGCSWCPTQKNVIATGCKDGRVRVFDCSWKEGLDPQYVLMGHTQRVFHVCWSPLLDGTLASGSDDTTIIVWCLHPKSLPRSEPAGGALNILPSAVLTGHTSNVRPIHWNSEVPWLLLSGSWDGTVRAWDIRNAGIGLHESRSASRGRGSTADIFWKAGSFEDSGGSACIACMSDHVADVYGLSASPARPFTYTSVSRDTTLRVFNLEGIVSSIKTRAVIKTSLHSMLANPSDSMLPAAPTALCGTASRFLETQLRSLRRTDGGSSVAAFRKLFDFFWGSDGIETFWEIMRWVVGSAAASPRANMLVGDGDAAPHRASGSPAADQRQRRSQGGGGDAAETTIVEGEQLNRRTGTPLRQVPEGLMCVEERVVHRDARRASDAALARLLSASPTFIVQDRRLGKSDRLERASRLHLAAGDLRSSCEAFIALGRWQTALSLAPGVGMEYWRAVADRYIEVLVGGARVRDSGADNEGGSGGQVSADVTTLATALLASTGRPMDAVRDLLKGSEEALSLAAAVADGAYPPVARKEPFPEEPPSPPPVVVAHAVAEEKETSPRRVYGGERRVEDSATVGGRAEEGGSRGAKLLALIDDHVEDGNGTAGCGGGAADSTGEEEHEEVKASPKHGDPSEAIRAPVTCSGRSLAAEAAEKRSSTHSSERKSGGSSTPPLPHKLNSRQKLVPVTATSAAAAAAAAAAAQRSDAEETLRSITESKAEAFFQASQPALAAASMLSICDGSRETAARALTYLIRGEEPELAYAAAAALKFPARELTLFLREMSRRAEAWGDSNLSAELLLNARVDDELSGGVDCECGIGSKPVDGSVASEGGFWPADMYGACGEESGPRGAAMVAARAATGSRSENAMAPTRASPRPSLSLRSSASYLEDAAAAVHRGMVGEAVRLLVLGGDLEQACDRGVSFLRDHVPVLSFPPRPVKKSASAVVRALGSDGGLASDRISPRLRMQVLAYASYIGALEAMVRGYNPVVAPLLRTASICVQAAERMASAMDGAGTPQTAADEKHGDSGDAPPDAEAGAQGRSRSSECGRGPSQRRPRSVVRRRGRSSPRHGGSRSPSSLDSDRSRRSLSPPPATPTVFPPCMSGSALALAAMRHLASWAKEPGSPDYAREAGLGYARLVRDEAGSFSAKDAKAVDDLLLSAEQRAAAPGIASEARRQGSTTMSETKSRFEPADAGDASSSSGDDAEAKVDTAGRRRRRTTSEWVSGDGHTGNRAMMLPAWQSACGEIVVSGSRLPSCRRHERVAWRTEAGEDSAFVLNPPPYSKRMNPLATSSLDFGREPLPRARGAAFFLEDGETVLGLNEAVMWSKVNPLSPLNTGCRIMPF